MRLQDKRTSWRMMTVRWRKPIRRRRRSKKRMAQKRGRKYRSMWKRRERRPRMMRRRGGRMKRNKVSKRGLRKEMKKVSHPRGMAKLRTAQARSLRQARPRRKPSMPGAAARRLRPMAQKEAGHRTVAELKETISPASSTTTIGHPCQDRSCGLCPNRRARANRIRRRPRARRAQPWAGLQSLMEPLGLRRRAVARPVASLGRAPPWAIAQRLLAIRNPRPRRRSSPPQWLVGEPRPRRMWRHHRRAAATTIAAYLRCSAASGATPRARRTSFLWTVVVRASASRQCDLI
mmetsp:Transcript_73736/g.205091  ORF Transcript_73736/g.205091 Transcript_73736/m.205091 type:complete len:290 (+) Transcript_73736:1060-1929(+)